MKRKTLSKNIAMIMAIICAFSSLIGCNSTQTDKEKETQKELKLPPMTTDEITLTYMCWQDDEISEALAKDFEAMYSNIDVVVKTYDLGSSSDDLWGLYSINDLPDCFWILGSPETYIKEGMLYDMSELWNNDPDSRNVIKGINEYKLGYFGTNSKWTTPVKFFPTTAFLNLDVFIRNDKDMPDTDWTWEEFEDTVEAMTMEDKNDGSYIFGLSGCSIVQWYPLASDKNCIGEFGWNGQEFDMENWAYAMNLEAKWIQNENKPETLDYVGQMEEKYGDGSVLVEDEGYSSIHIDYWWTWENYYAKDEYIQNNKVVFVPYMMPMVEGVEGTYSAVMDMGAISSTTKYPREAYELLKYMTWGTEGWMKKLEYYPDLLENSTGNVEPLAKNNMPITTDADVWEGFINWHPNTEIGDEYIVELYGEDYNRTQYFEDFMNKVKSSTWTCYAGLQIAGFEYWYQCVYCGKDGLQDFGYNQALGIEVACIYGGVDAKAYYEYLETEANKCYRDKLQEIEEALKEVESK